MAPIPASEKKSLGNVLVIGGCGFLGHHIVDLLLSSYICKVSVLDLRTTTNRLPDSSGVNYFDGDITNLESLTSIFQKIKPDVVIHTASPAVLTTPNPVLYKVNVGGTACVIEACQKTGVKALVYTSSASVISDCEMDLINADERWPVIPARNQKEYYTQTKAEAEALVLAANRSPSHPKFLTVSLRPAGIFGPGDLTSFPRMINAYLSGKTNFQLGSNDNLFDFTYVTNVAHAHILASLALLHTSTLSSPPAEKDRVDGEPFFITNDSPVYFWDFARTIWKYAGNTAGTEKVWTIGKETGLLIAGVMEWVYWGLGRKSELTKTIVTYSCMTRYYDCGKAKRRLGYVPLVGLEEGIKKGVKCFEKEIKAGKLDIN